MLDYHIYIILCGSRMTKGLLSEVTSEFMCPLNICGCDQRHPAQALMRTWRGRKLFCRGDEFARRISSGGERKNEGLGIVTFCLRWNSYYWPLLCSVLGVITYKEVSTLCNIIWPEFCFQKRMIIKNCLAQRQHKYVCAPFFGKKILPESCFR